MRRSGGDVIQIERKLYWLDKCRSETGMWQVIAVETIPHSGKYRCRGPGVMFLSDTAVRAARLVESCPREYIETEPP